MKSYFPALIWALVILVLSLAPGPSLPGALRDLLSFDKVSHAAAYFLLTVLLGWAFSRRKSRRPRLWLTAAVVSSVYGVAMELAQYAFFPYRYFELYDILANIIGSVMGLFVLKFLIQ